MVGTNDLPTVYMHGGRGSSFIPNKKAQRILLKWITSESESESTELTGAQLRHCPRSGLPILVNMSNLGSRTRRLREEVASYYRCVN